MSAVESKPSLSRQIPSVLRLGLALCLAMLGTPRASSAQALAAFELVLTRVAGPLAEGAIRTGLSARKQALLTCLRAHEAVPALGEAEVSLRVMVASNGEVVTAEVQDARGVEVERCIAEATETAVFSEQPAFTTFMVVVRLGLAVRFAHGEAAGRAHPTSAAPAVAPSAAAQVTLLLTRVRGQLRPSAARRGFVAAQAGLRACYLAEVRRTPVAEMRLRLVVDVDAAGHVQRVGESAGATLSPAFEDCLDRALRAQAFPAPTAGVAEIEQSVRFQSLTAAE